MMRMRRMFGISAAMAMMALTACAEFPVPDALDTTPEVVALMDCSTAADTLERANDVLEVYAEVTTAIAVSAPVLDRLGISLTSLSRAVNIAEVESAVAALQVRVSACA